MPQPLSSLASQVDSRVLWDFLNQSEYEKRTRQVESWLARKYYNGQGYFSYDPETGTVGVDEEVLNGMVANYAARTVDTSHATMMEVSLRPEGYALTGQPSDHRSAKAMSACFHDHWDRNNSNSTRREMTHSLCITGAEFLCHYWDEGQLGIYTFTPEELMAWEMMTGDQPQSVHPVGEGKLRAVVKVGGTVERRVSGDLIFVESGPKCWADVTRFAVVSYPSVNKALADFSDSPNAGEIRPIPIANVRTGGTRNANVGTSMYRGSDNQQIPTSFSARAGRTAIAEFWLKSGNVWERIVQCGPGFRYTLQHDTQIAMNPYVMYRFKETDEFWPKSIFTDILRPSYAVNVLMTQQLQLMAEGIKTTLMVPFNTKLDQMTNDFFQIVRFDATGQPPIVRPADGSVLAMHSQIIDRLVGVIQYMGQVGDVAQGDIRPRTSRFAISEAKESLRTALGDVRDRMRDSEKESAKIIARLYQENATIPRIAKIVGENGEPFAMDFMGSDIVSGTDVRITDTDESPRAKEQRFDYALQLLKYGFFDHTIPGAEVRNKAILDFVDSGRVEDVKPQAIRMAEQEALAEEQALMDGRVAMLPIQVALGETPDQEADLEFSPNVLAYIDVPVPTPLISEEQNHEIHVATHEIRIMDPETPEEVKQLLRFHVMIEHSTIIAQQEKARLEQEIEIRRQMSLADAAGTAATAALQASMGSSGNSGNPTQGGKQSGKTRSRR